jgi:predicted metal-dependent hydrolase
MRLAVYCNGSIVVTTPFGIDQPIIEKFIADKKQWLADKINFFKSVDSKKIRTFSSQDYLMHKDEALALVLSRLKFLNKKCRFRFKEIYIKNQKTRWGSCSKNKNLNFNYKLIFLPKKQQDYIIVHELCHLREFNHSRKFWSLVAELMPDYLDIKNELRNQGLFYK